MMKPERETRIVEQIEALMIYRGEMPQRGKLREIIRAIAECVREEEIGEIREYTRRQIAELTGFPYSTICIAAQEAGFNLGKADNRYRYHFTQTQFEKIRAVLEKKKRRIHYRPGKLKGK
ncbi:hypothetical protein ES708_28288 [subsurface metagenome]